MSLSERTDDWHLGPTRRMNRISTPEAAPVLKPDQIGEVGMTIRLNKGPSRDIPQHGSARLFAHRTARGDRQVSLVPLVRHQDVAVLVLQNVLAHAGESRPFTVGNRLGRAPFMHFALAHLTGEAMRGGIATHTAVGGSDVGGGGVPVMVIAQEVGRPPIEVFISARGRVCVGCVGWGEGSAKAWVVEGGRGGGRGRGF